MGSIPSNSVALLVIDVQEAFVQRDNLGDQRNNPQAESRINDLLSAFRAQNLPVYHIHHHSLEKESLFRAELSGSAVQAFAAPLSGEAVYIKHANSAFIGTTLEQDLRAAGPTTLVMCGATANHCVETTTRMAGNLGFDTWYVGDAVWAYAATGPDGVQHSADQVNSMSLCNLDGEFATVVSAQQVLDKFCG